MARLEPLIRYRKHSVDEKRRALANLYREADTLQRYKDELLMQLAREQALAESSENFETQAYFGRFAQRVREQVDAVDGAMAKLNVRIALAQDDVRDAFAEMKKIEITDRERKKRDAKAVEDKERKELDEIALSGYARGQNTNIVKVAEEDSD